MFSNEVKSLFVSMIVGMSLVLIIVSFINSSSSSSSSCSCKVNVDRFNYYLENYSSVPYVSNFVDDNTTIGELKEYKERLGPFFDAGINYFDGVCE